MPCQTRALWTILKYERYLQRHLKRNVHISTTVTRCFKRIGLITKAVKPRHVFYAAATATIGAGAVASLGLAGLAISGAHSAAFTYKDDGDADETRTLERNIDKLPTEYDVPAIQAYWRARPVEVLCRMTQVSIVFVPYITKLIIWEYLIRRKIRHHDGLQQKVNLQFL